VGQQDTETERKLRYSERQQMAETGGLGALEYDEIPPALITAVAYTVKGGTEAKNVGHTFAGSLHRAGIEHFGWNPNTENYESGLTAYGLGGGPSGVMHFLDLIEIIAEEASRPHAYRGLAGHSRGGSARYAIFHEAALPDFESTFNRLADRHRFGYRLEDGEIRRIGSPALADVVVGPALLAVQRPGWEQVERSYREALDHQRGPQEENDDALTAASAALEAALKAVGISGNTLGQLAARFKKSSLAAPQVAGVPELLDQLLTRAAAVRNIHGDVHGRAPGAHPPVPQELVDLAIHLVGSFIVYLDGATR
jgi:hypothetical protein